jgi:hypothetical protein
MANDGTAQPAAGAGQDAVPQVPRQQWHSDAHTETRKEMIRRMYVRISSRNTLNYLGAVKRQACKTASSPIPVPLTVTRIFPPCIIVFFFPCSLSLHARTSLVALACCQGFTPISFPLPLFQIASLAATAKSHTAGPSAAGEDADDRSPGRKNVVLPVVQPGMRTGSPPRWPASLLDVALASPLLTFPM